MSTHSLGTTLVVEHIFTMPSELKSFSVDKVCNMLLAQPIEVSKQSRNDMCLWHNW